MKFSKDGACFDDIISVRNKFCYLNSCTESGCVLYSHSMVTSCDNFCNNNPKKAAELMGYEVIEDDPGIMSKPRICEILGVDVGERFWVKEGTEDPEERDAIYILDDGTVKWERDRPSTPGASLPALRMVIYAIQHPESLIRKPRLTEKELEICRIIGAKYVSMDEPHSKSERDEKFIEFWYKKPVKGILGVYSTFADGNVDDFIGYLKCRKGAIFSEMKPGDCICVEDMLKDD